jgi:hypothetical protein
MAILAAAMLAPRPSLSAGLPDCGLMQSDCRDLIGKRLWIVIPNSSPPRCTLRLISAAIWLDLLTLRKLASYLVNAIFIATFIANDFGCLGNEWGGQYFRQSYLTLTLLSVDKSRLDVSLHQ